MNTQLSISIPHPENPCHVDNLTSVSLLEAQGFTGSDADLATSLFEYGLACRNLPDGQTLFVHRHSSRDDRFERSTFDTDTDCKLEFGWVNWQDIYRFTGLTETEWQDMPLPAKLSDLRGGDEKENAAAIRDVLAGKRTPLRDIAVLNAAAALIVADKATNLMDGAALAAHSIESGAARAALDKLVAISNGRS